MASNSTAPSDGEQILDVPFGYRFYPSDDQVIYYLKQKVLGRELPADIIPTIDVYTVRPDQLPLDKFRYGVAGEWFFFTTHAGGYSQINDAGGYSQINDGYWQSANLPTEIIDVDVDVNCFKQVFKFYWGISPNGTESNWIIYEYRLNLDKLEIDFDLDQNTRVKVKNFVACRVRNLEEFQLFNGEIQEVNLKN